MCRRLYAKTLMSNRAWLAAFNVSGNGYRMGEPKNSLECIVKAELRQIMSGPASYFSRETEVVSPTKSVKIPGPLRRINSRFIRVP